jgi:hypothetical protein
MGLNIHNPEERDQFARKLALEHITRGQEPQTIYEHNTVRSLTAFGATLLTRAAVEMKPLPLTPRGYTLGD